MHISVIVLLSCFPIDKTTIKKIIRSCSSLEVFTKFYKKDIEYSETMGIRLIFKFLNFSKLNIDAQLKIKKNLT